MCDSRSIHTRCRESELLAPTWPDIDLDRGTLTVRRSLVTVKEHTLVFGEPKSQTSRRTIALPS